MKIVDGTWSVVLVGKWNRYILTPEWVAQKIFGDGVIEIQFPINRPELAPRYKSSSNIIFMPAVHRCQFIAQDPYDNEMLIRISQFIHKLTETLGHTPVSAMGINFGFEEGSDNFNYLELFQLFDSDKFAELNYQTNSTEVKRQFKLENRVLNLNVGYNQNSVSFDFNFHYDVKDPAQVFDLSTKNLLIDNRDVALGIMKEVYDLELDLEGEEL